jgi:hypothetical protein
MLDNNWSNSFSVDLLLFLNDLFDFCREFFEYFTQKELF